MADRITYVGLECSQGKHRCRGSVGRVCAARCGNTADREHGDGAGPFAAQAARRWHGSAVLLRGWTVRLWIQRHVSARGHECVVVAPSLIPKRAGDRVKTDRRDAASLASCNRAGELNGGVGSGSPARGDARSRPRAA